MNIPEAQQQDVLVKGRWQGRVEDRIAQHHDLLSVRGAVDDPRGRHDRVNGRLVLGKRDGIEPVQPVLKLVHRLGEFGEPPARVACSACG